MNYLSAFLIGWAIGDLFAILVRQHKPIRFRIISTATLLLIYAVIVRFNLL